MAPYRPVVVTPDHGATASGWPVRAGATRPTGRFWCTTGGTCSRGRAGAPAPRSTTAMSLLGETLKIRREELGLGQGEVAQKLDVSQQTVSRWEKGLALPRPNRVVQLADLLDVDSGHLHRLAGYLPEEERSELAGPFREVYAGMAQMSRAELMLLLDRAWQELRRREGLNPPGIA